MSNKTGKIRLAMFGSLYEISDKEMEDEEKTKRKEEGQVSLPPSYEVL